MNRATLRIIGISALLAVMALPAAAQLPPMGIIRTFAGGGTADPGDDGAALDAMLASPGGLARDAAGNLFIADTGHHRIRRVDVATGVITTVAGTGLAGFSGNGGPATAAQLNAPGDVALDAAGNLYIADTGSHCIREVSASSGVIQTIAGICGSPGFGSYSFPATMVPLDHPTGVAVNARGNVLIADRDNHRIIGLGGDGFMRPIVGNSPIPPTGLPRAHCPIDGVFGIHTPPGLGGYTGDGGDAASAQLRCPTDVSVDADGNLYIGDTSNHAIRKVTASTGFISTLAGGHFYERVLGGGIARICSIAGDGGPATDAYLCDPKTAAADAAGNVYVADSGNHRIRKIVPSGAIMTLTSSSVMPATSPYASGYVTGASGFSGDEGPAAEALLSGPAGLAVDPVGSLYIADTGNHRIRSILRSDVPLSGDLDGDGAADLVMWRPANGTWYWLTSSSGYDPAQGGARHWGSALEGDVPLLGDIDGDGLADPIVWRARTGLWYWLTSSTGYDYAHAGARHWGSETLGDVPLIGDLDGDGRGDLVVWRASTGSWFWLTSSSGYDVAQQGGRRWGTFGDVPLLGDMDGDRRADLIVWRPSTGTWYWVTSGTGFDYGRQGQQEWGRGTLGDVPLLRDFDGDGVADLAVWRAETGTWYWLCSREGYNPIALRTIGWGVAASGDIPLVTDLDGDGKADLAIWRAMTGTWYWLASSMGYSPAAAVARSWGTSR